MKLISIKDTDLNFTPLAMGTAEFGSSVSEELSFQMLDRYVEGGGNWIDTARVYADWLPGGHSKSETTVGNWLRSSTHRDKVLLSTKGGHPRLSSMDVSRLSQQEIYADVEESLTLLGVDTIDLYWLHRDDTNKPVSSMIDTLNALVSEGKIRYFGSSNWHPYRIKEAADYAKANNLQTFVASQIQWSLAELNEGAIADPTTIAMDNEALSFYKATGMTVFAYTSQAKGFFQKLHAGGIEALKPGLRNAYDNERNRNRLALIKDISNRMNVSISSVVLSYLTSQSFPVVPVIGASSTEQVEEATAALEVSLTAEDLVSLEQGF